MAIGLSAKLFGQWFMAVNSPDFTYTHDVNTRAIEVLPADGTGPINPTVEAGGARRNAFCIRAGETARVAFRLLRGAVASGRVVDDNTGGPIAGVKVIDALGERCVATTDRDGRFTVKGLAVGNDPEQSFEVGVITKGDVYVSRESEPVLAGEGQSVAVPDIRLRRGGWISGTVVPPLKELWSARLAGDISARLQGPLPKGCLLPSAGVADDGGYRIGPLPPGLYSVGASLSTGKATLPGSPLVWHGMSHDVQVTGMRETRNVVVYVSLDRAK